MVRFMHAWMARTKDICEESEVILGARAKCSKCSTYAKKGGNWERGTWNTMEQVGWLVRLKESVPQFEFEIAEEERKRKNKLCM